MAINKYYLFARNSTNNKLDVIDIDRENIYSDNYDYQSDERSLQEIDLYTTKFNSCIELKKKIGTDSDEFFIVSRVDDKVSYYPVIYSSDKMSSSLRKLAKQYDNEYLDAIYVDIILDEFSSEMINDIDYYKFVISNYPDLYKHYLNNLTQYKYGNSDNIWIISLYPVIREIVESLNKYNNYYIDTNTNCGYTLSDKFDFLDNKFDTEKERLDIDKINYIFEFVDKLNYDSIVINNKLFNINTSYLYCDENVSKQLNSLDDRIKRLFYLISVCRFVNGYENKKYNTIVNSLKDELIEYLGTGNNLNSVYCFVKLYEKCMEKKENIIYGKK